MGLMGRPCGRERPDRKVLVVIDSRERKEWERRGGISGGICVAGLFSSSDEWVLQRHSPGDGVRQLRY